MNIKTKIDKYVKTITKNETYNKYLIDACNFGYSIAQAEIKDLKAKLSAFEDCGFGIIIDEYDELEGF